MDTVCNVSPKEYWQQWLEDERLELQRSTYEAYTVYFNRHIIPYFEARTDTLMGITPRMVKEYVNYIRTGGRMDGKNGGLSEASVKKHLSLIKQSLNDAVCMEYIPSNPALSVKLRRQPKPVSDKVVMLTPEEAQRVIDAFRGHILYPLVVIAFYYGLRKSEILGLKWSAIDFDKNEMRIEHTVVKSLTIEEKDSTKTELSKAVYELLPDVRQMLLKMKSQAPAGTEYICVWPDGRLIRPDYIPKAFKQHLVKHGLSPMRFHDLRHSCASILFDNGTSLEDVKNWLRHSDIETTSNIYLHYNLSRRKLVSTSMNGLFSI